MDIYDKAENYTIVRDGKAAGIYPYFNAITSRQHSEVTMQGRRTIMLGSNNYLGLTSNQRVIDAAKDALEKYGAGCSGSRFLNGTLDLHEQLEAELAEFFGKEAVMTFSTGFQSNLGIIAGLADRHTTMYYDRYNHASLYDAARLSYAKLMKYDHNDMEQLEKLLQNTPETRSKLIVTDGVFSMEGDLCNLPEIVRLARKYNARIMVDDSHGIGTVGATGRGVCEYFDLMDEVDILMGTFSKSFASLGGFYAGTKTAVEFVQHTSRPFIFSASIPPSNAAAVLEALHILREDPSIVQRVNDNANYMREGSRRLGLPLNDSTTPIIPVMTYEDMRTFLITKALLENGVYVNPVISPAVPEGGALLRTSYTATHTKDQLDYALEKFDLVFNKSGL